MPEFKPYGKTPRLNRDIIITEKIDGTNAGIIIESAEEAFSCTDTSIGVTLFPKQGQPGEHYGVTAQSRNRIIRPNSYGQSTDNAGFAKWVWEHAATLVQVLGVGTHFGEWFGQGIQRGYGLDHKRFALFNVDRYDPAMLFAARMNDVNIDTVPELYRGPFDQNAIIEQVTELADNGSLIPGASGFKAEGVIVFHTASRVSYKVLCEDDHLPKSLAGAA